MTVIVVTLVGTLAIIRRLVDVDCHNGDVMTVGTILMLQVHSEDGRSHHILGVLGTSYTVSYLLNV